jgi:chromosome partitioning protein
MKILQLTNRKGGVGKTTIACHAAWYFSENRRVLFVELDEQRNASRTLRAHKIDLETPALLAGAANIPGLTGPGISLIAAHDDLKRIEAREAEVKNLMSNILNAADGYDICIIDSAPKGDYLNISPMLFATHLLAPIELAPYSLHGVESLLKSIVGVRQQLNPDLDFLGMLPNKFVANSPLQKQTLTELFEKVGPHFMFDAVITARQAFEHTATTMEPVWKDTKTAARVAGKEIRRVMEKIESRIFG